MWFEERSWSNIKASDLVEEWRDLWSFKIDFLVAAVAYVCATTNLLNLPKLILENGGLAFVSAYGVSLLVCVLPIIILELAVGQLTGRAPVLAFHTLAPITKGVGVAQTLLCVLVLATMTRYLAQLLLFFYYLFWSLIEGRPDVPWLRCRGFPEFVRHGEACRDAGQLANLTIDAHTKISTLNQESSMMHFVNTLDPSSQSIADFGDFNLHFLIGHGVVWVGVFVMICFGVRLLGKLIPFSIIAAFSALLALCIRALTIDGLPEILQVFWKATDWRKLEDYTVWALAGEQAIMACGVGFGAFITMGSYSKRSNNLVADSVLIVFAHIVFSLMQVATVIGLVGYVSVKSGLPPSELMVKGEEQLYYLLAYFSHLPQTVLWSGILLFSSIFILYNIFALLSLSILSTLEDALGEKASKCFPRFLLAFFVCSLVMACSLYFTTQAGRHAYELAVGSLRYVTLWSILAAELLAVAWIYCGHRLGNDLHFMLSPSCCWCLGHFLLFFTYLLPIVPIGIAFVNVSGYDFSRYSPAIHAWPWSEWVGAALALIPVVPIPLYAILTFFIACCCANKHESKKARVAEVVRHRVRRFSSERSALGGRDTVGGLHAPPRYSSAAPGYLLLPQAPLAEPEPFNEGR
ncbi:unnamed protein product, partial [Mesorhabditis belari]|uniref:Uncharacterized protein n=1 Tax=Mesorhabditis belari TaxID=2138241 RepID=A0AAF3FAL6_9BILA